ncbi:MULTISPECIES: tautomerase family protein [unclassified Isoptericola]|uniref:tautomerase family protein n=1 Tax=unclassified Isoptericola TaxID=2623355 RepID=UPI0027125051|nr:MULTISPECIES: tautomerase family protein [unclassified Isoptericola]MDO8145267.1 tautomerase family protein [Isoptericola sp. 178]MDO8148903.1 tautomerase family protein [Isoptericola sp. b515]MDO8151154.1 tautomerase family protein [Isoptericola sp. b408]
MAQVKIYGNRTIWGERREEVSDAVHDALVTAWRIPEDKRFHRFLLLEDGDLVAPRSDAYLLIEVVCFSGRSTTAKKALVRAMYDEVAPALDLADDDLEVVILESRPENWGIRGRTADELALTYPVEV